MGFWHAVNETMTEVRKSHVSWYFEICSARKEVRLKRQWHQRPETLQLTLRNHIFGIEYSIETESHRSDWNSVHLGKSNVNSLKSRFNRLIIILMCDVLEHERVLRYKCGYWLAKLNGIFPFFIAIFFVPCVLTRTYRPSNWSLQSAPFELRWFGENHRKKWFFVYARYVRNNSISLSAYMCVCFVYFFGITPYDHRRDPNDKISTIHTAQAIIKRMRLNYIIKCYVHFTKLRGRAVCGVFFG